MTDRQAFFRMFRYMRPYFVFYAIGILLYCAQQFIMPLINGIVFGTISAGILAQDFSYVVSGLRFMVVVTLIYFVAVGIGTYFYVMAVSYGARDFRLKIFRAFMKTSVENAAHSGEGIAAINTDAEMACNIHGNALSPLLNNIIAVVFSSIAVFIIDWRMGLGVVGVGLIIFLAQARFAGPLARLGAARLEANADAVKSVSNIFAGALTIRAFNRQDRSLFQFDHENGRLKKLAFKQAFIGMWQDLFTTVQGWLILALVFALGGWMVATRRMDFPSLMIIFPMAEAIGRAMSEMGANFAGLQPPIVAAKRTLAIIDAAPPTEECESVANWDKKYEININELEFFYKDAEQSTLKDISLNIQENTMVAFVGESGSGKSTLLRAIIGMYEREDMDMKLGSLPFSPKNLKEWRSHFAYVDQSCKLFDMTIAENISMGLAGQATQDDIETAAKRAYAHDFISDLPEGYATDCGEKGGSLSGGEQQMLALSRALMSKPKLLLIDELSMGLAPILVDVLFDKLIQINKNGATVLLVEQDAAAALSLANRAYVMETGNIALSGNSADLLDDDRVRMIYLGG